MKISIIRGAFLNPFELQNYEPIRDRFFLTAISSKNPISDKIKIPLIKLWSPTDLPNFPFKYPILNRIFTDAHRLYGLEKKLKGVDIAHVAETYYGYTHQAIMAKRKGVVRKVVSTVWEIIPHNNESITGRREYKRVAYENIDKFIAVTEMAKSCLIKEGVKKEKIEVINIGIDIDRFVPDKSKTKKRDLNILCVARLVPEKGVTDLLKAFNEVRKKRANIHLTFVGDGPLKSDLTGFKNVHIKKVPYNKMPGEYQKADIFCLPSRKTRTWQEQYGMCLIEAMACGLPIVSTNTGAIEEVCGDTALYARPENWESLKTNLEKLIYNLELREQLSKRSRARAIDKYDCSKIAEKIAFVYEQVCL